MIKQIHQEEILNYLQSFLVKDIMIPIHGRITKYGTNAYFQSIVVPLEFAKADIQSDNVNNWLRNPMPGFTQYSGNGDGEIVYSKYGKDGCEPFAIRRNFEGLGVEDYYEIVEEFRLLNNLYYDVSKNIYIDLVSDTIVVKIIDNHVLVHKTYLKRYLSVKNMALMIHIDSRVDYNGSECDSPSNNKQHRAENTNYSLHYGNVDRKKFSLLYYKTLIYGVPIEKCGYPPYDEQDTSYVEFIIGLDEDGAEITCTCNPDELDNDFGANPNKPHYLAPVFFKREVLKKYYDNPKKYTIQDGHLSCGSRWSLRMDNNLDEYVSVYLGDLGSDLPDTSEQQYWRTFNIAIDGKLSEAKFKRDFLGLWSNSDSPIFIFKNAYINLNKEFEKKFGWPLFLPLHDDEKYIFDGLRLPIGNDQPEFDTLVLALTKLINDSLNEKEVKKLLSSISDLKTGSINRLEKWFEISGLSNYLSHIEFLRKLQGLRSSSSAHKKGKEYEKSLESLEINKNDTIKGFRKLIIKATDFINFINNSITKLKL